MSLGRRRLLRLIAVHLPVPALIACAPPPPPSWEELAFRAAAWFAREDLESARAIGERALDKWGRGPEVLEPELAPTLALLEDPLDLVMRVDLAIEADFVAQRARDVDGWVLAATETHLCALLSLFDVTPERLDRPGA